MISPRAALFVICGAVVASPILTYSSLFYPEIPACLLISVALRNLMQMEEHRWRAFFWLAFTPGALMWLHPKYLALALCIVITGTIFFYRTFHVYNNKRIPFLYGTVAALGILTFFLFLHSEYGGWSPNRIYAGWEKAPQSLFDLIRQEGIARIGTMLRMILGFWIDQRFGLIVHAPLYVLFFPGFIYVFRKNNVTRFVLFWFLTHFLIICWGAPLGGFAPPSRHMIVLLPIVLITIAYVFSEFSSARQLGAVILFALSWILAAMMYFDFRSLFTNVTWRNPDGISPFWERYGIDQFIPLLTASALNWMQIVLWCFALAGLSWFFYPRVKQVSSDHS
jgi:hypothetical protein